MIIMTAEESVIVMIGGAGSSGGAVTKAQIPNNISYYNYQTSVYNYGNSGSGFVSEEIRTVPKDSLVFQYYNWWYDENGNSCYKYTFCIYQLIIEDIDTADEEVVGIKDLQTGKEYRFQFNEKGGR